MKIHQLQYLVAAAERGSVRAAALSLGVSPTAVGRALIELEEALGTTLVLRQAQGIALSEAGQALLPHARLILGQIAEATAEVQRRQAGNPTLSVAVTPWICESLLPRVVRAFRAQRPDVRLNLSETLGSTHDSLRDGSLDVSIGLSPPEGATSEFREVRLFSYGSTVLCRRGHPQAGARSIGQLRELEWILSREVAQFQPPLSELLEPALSAQGHARVHIARSASIAMGIVEETDLLTVSPWPLVETRNVRGRLEALNLQEQLPDSVTSLLTRRNGAASVLVKQFVNCLLAVIHDAAGSADPVLRRVLSTVDLIDAR